MKTFKSILFFSLAVLFIGCSDQTPLADFNQDAELRRDDAIPPCASTFEVEIVETQDTSGCCIWEVVVTNPDDFDYYVEVNGVIPLQLPGPVRIRSCDDEDFTVEVYVITDVGDALCFQELLNCDTITCCDSLFVTWEEIPNPANPYCLTIQLTLTSPANCINSYQVEHFWPEGCLEASRTDELVNDNTRIVTITQCCEDEKPEYMHIEISLPGIEEPCFVQRITP